MAQNCKYTTSLAALFIAIGISLGAIGAHLLKPLLDGRDFEIYQTAVFYHLFNALGALVIAALSPRYLAERRARLISLTLLIGIIIFSGSLYLLVATNTRWLGAITPIGGMLLIASWGWLALSIFTTHDSPDTSK